jgi:uncharacterized protein (DUF58 family)
MRTERAAFTYTLFAMFIAFALVFGSMSMLFLAGITASILLVSSTMAPSGDIEIYGIRRLSDDKAYEDGKIKVVLRVRNRGRGTLFHVIEGIPDGARVEGKTEDMRYLKKGAELSLKYTISFPLKGKYRIGPVRIRCFDPMMFWVREYRIDLMDEIDVYVGTEDLRKAKIEPTKTRNWLGNIMSRRIGIGTEFYSIREYVSGDDMRQINWKASARSPRLLVNEHEGENSGDAVIVLDAKEEYLSGTESNNTFKAGVRTTLSIAAHLLRNRNRVGLVLLGDYLMWIYPEFGRRQLYKFMEAVSSLKKGGKWEFDTLYWIMTRFFPKNAYIIVISTLQSPEIPETIIQLRARGYDGIIISPSPIAIERSLAPPDKEHELAFRIL